MAGYHTLTHSESNTMELLLFTAEHTWMWPERPLWYIKLEMIQNMLVSHKFPMKVLLAKIEKFVTSFLRKVS
jgi:hypothetical protein